MGGEFTYQPKSGSQKDFDNHGQLKVRENGCLAIAHEAREPEILSCDPAESICLVKKRLPRQSKSSCT